MNKNRSNKTSEFIKEEKGDIVTSTDSYGTKRWHLNNKLHREDGPAIKFLNGDKFWFQNNKLHRADGPAAEHANGYRSWHLHGLECTEKEFKKKTKGMYLGKELFTV